MREGRQALKAAIAYILIQCRLQAGAKMSLDDIAAELYLPFEIFMRNTKLIQLNLALIRTISDQKRFQARLMKIADEYFAGVSTPT